MFKEALGRNYSDPSGANLRTRHNAFDAAIVIDVAVRVDHRKYRLCAQMLAHQLERGLRNLK
jgi:hypothetical protein